MAAALLGLGLQALVVSGIDPRLDARLASNLLGICIALLATSSAIWAARSPEAYARRFWQFTAASLAVYTLASFLSAYYDSVLRADLHAVWPSDILYFLFPAPLVLALYLRPREPGSGTFEWAECFDFLQIAILAGSSYFYYFYLPSHWIYPGSAELSQWKVALVRDALLLLAFALRFGLANTAMERALLSRIGVSFALFSACSLAFFERQITAGLDSGTLWDLSFTLPLVVLTLGAVTWRLPEQAGGAAPKRSARRQTWTFVWISVLLPLLVVGVAGRLAHERPLLATVLVVITLASAGARSYFTHQQERQAARAMIEAEKKFRILFQDNPQPTCLYDPSTGRFLEVNRAAIEKYGYTREEFLQRTISDLCLDLQPQRLAAAQQGVEVRGELWRQQKKDGSVLEVILFARTIEFEGRPARLIVTQDITDRRQAERLQAALYRIAEVSTTAGDLNALYQAIHGIVAHLLDARNFYIALYEPGTDQVSFPYFVDEHDPTPMPRAPRKGLTEYVLHTGEPLLATGERLNQLAAAGLVERTGSPADDWLGVPLKRGEETFGVLAIQHYASRTHFGARERDVLTFVSQQVAHAIERKRSEEALLRSESRYRSLVQSAVVGIFRATQDWRFLEVNPALAATLGYGSVGEFLSVGLQCDVFADERAKVAIQGAFLRRGRFEGIEALWRRRDDAWITVRLSGRGVWDEREGTEIYEVIAEDVTERKALEEQLRQAQKMEAVGTLAGGVAHDFNNLLTVISGYSRLLAERHAHDAQSSHSIEQIAHASERAASLTRQLLAFSRRQLLQPRLVNLNTLVGSVERMLHPLLGERIQIVVDAGRPLGTVRADPGQLEHVLMNLAVNARDAMPRGGRLTLRTADVELGPDFSRKHPGAAPGSYVMLAVSDTGTGMDSHALAHLFEPFFTTKEPGKGTGLGLSMVYGIVKQSGGYITVESSPGQGSTFCIYLPRVEGVEEHSRAHKRRSPPRQTGSGTVLLVEDEEAVRSLVQAILSADGYQVLAAATPAQAIALCRAHPGNIDVLLTDVVMPEASGPELAKSLLSLRPELKVVYMSGYAGEHLDQEGLGSEGALLLQKPFTTAALEEKIRQALRPPVSR
jgi:PAS domain S-box-containing protein